MVTILCTVVRNKVMTTKSNTLMAFTTVEDLTGTMELLVFPRVFAACRGILQENAVVIAQGRVSYKEDEGTRLLVENVLARRRLRPRPLFCRERGQPPGAKPRPSAPGSLWLLVPSRQCRQMARIENLLHNIFDGHTPVYFKFEDSGQYMRAPQSLWANDGPLLRAELERILGAGHVKTRAAK